MNGVSESKAVNECRARSRCFKSCVGYGRSGAKERKNEEKRKERERGAEAAASTFEGFEFSFLACKGLSQISSPSHNFSRRSQANQNERYQKTEFCNLGK